MTAALWKRVWALPWTLLGVTVGLVGLLTRGRARRRAGVWEFYGGAVTWLLNRLPIHPAAMTLGHAILGCSAECLDRSRAHELVHVRQYERWGVLFVPLYLFHSVRLWIGGRNPYLDNPFEREAIDEAG